MRFQKIDGTTTLQERPRREPPPRWAFPLLLILNGLLALAVVLAVLRGAG